MKYFANTLIIAGTRWVFALRQDEKRPAAGAHPPGMFFVHAEWHTVVPFAVVLC